MLSNWLSSDATLTRDEADGVVVPGPTAEAEAAAAEAEAPAQPRDEMEDWITGGQAAQEQREQRKARKAKAREEKARAAAAAGGGAAPAEAEAEPAPTEENSVFVGGIPFSSTVEDIRGFFETHGCGGFGTRYIFTNYKCQTCKELTVHFFAPVPVGRREGGLAVGAPL